MDKLDLEQKPQLTVEIRVEINTTFFYKLLSIILILNSLLILTKPQLNMIQMVTAKEAIQEMH
jgi:hypothetical protein